jgi:lipoyl(octanoyl) transferase
MFASSISTKGNKMMACEIIDLGKTHYRPCWDKQEQYFQERVSEKAKPNDQQQSFSDLLLLTEHYPVYTLGKSGKETNFIAHLQHDEVELVKINRGGDITYHGPGQLVAYPILDLERLHIGIANYIWKLEEVIIQLIAQYGLIGERLEGASGVWLDVHEKAKTRKLCAIGVRASRHITMHGLAFNVNTDLNYFKRIIPCGLPDLGVSSLEKELGTKVEMEEVKAKFSALFETLFYAKIPA